MNDARQKEILRRWVQQGAEYQQHWSYEKPSRAQFPAGQLAVDVLVRRRLAEVGLRSSPEASAGRSSLQHLPASSASCGFAARRQR